MYADTAPQPQGKLKRNLYLAGNSRSSFAFALKTTGAEANLAVYIVTYDLNSPGQNYSALIQAIKQFTHCNALKSAFFIDTHYEAAALRDHFKQYIDQNDTLYVMELKRHWACNRSTSCTTWLNDSARTWR